MQDKPDLSQLITAVQSFLNDKAMPELAGRTAFHARVAANVLSIVEREVRFGAHFASVQKARLEKILGVQADLETLNRLLCERLSNGELGLDSPLVKEHLIKSTMGKLAIDQPRYAGYARARLMGWPEEDGFSEDCE